MVKRIQVNLGASSVSKNTNTAQSADRRIVIKRTAQITSGDQKRLLFENQSIYISLEVVRRLPSPGSTTFDDNYGHNH